MPLADLRTVSVPKYDELSVKSIYPFIDKDIALKRYFPDAYPKGREPDRTYMFNILNTLKPEYVRDMIRHAQTQRNAITEESKGNDEIVMTTNWQQKLEQVPFISSKFHPIG